MKDIEAQVTWTDDPQQGIHIGAIPIHQSPSSMYKAGYFFDVLIEKPQGVWIGQH
jgi:hypothetical protein